MQSKQNDGKRYTKVNETQSCYEQCEVSEILLNTEIIYLHLPLKSPSDS